ncbi:hypothetical protein D3C85_1676390 [compost metagenome]
MLSLNLDPTVLVWQVVKLVDLDAGDVLESPFAIRIATDAVGYFAFLTGNPAHLGNEFLPECGNALGCILGKSATQPGNQQEMPVLKTGFGHFDACLLIHDSTPEAKKWVRLGV